MASISTFHKILHVKETDKHMAQKQYQQSVQEFEKIAMDMYELLKKKEKAETSYHNQLQHPTHVTDLHASSQYIEQLERKIASLQPSFQHARANMDHKQEHLTEAHVEMKKFEKLIDRKQHHMQLYQQELERKQMDEISVQQFLSQGNR
ncbi:flagellar export protein FliJ [Pontibacillus litoralis]|uniref:Flagellar FliJ protein n=1 Tax=Pontibacillus litoralis JSM 072002 TaxID=1385512 RepID=A0A0A5HXW3_9BACI|nr:flagellar export protein FliJ [Pontibacillus litoralis]KGX88447.1 hypothetical protein N784_07210 [Pontibacillus litoralis JSM 072002]